MPKFKYIRPDRRVFPDELDRTLAVMQKWSVPFKDEIMALTVILFYSGARISEALALVPDSIRDNEDNLEIIFPSLKREKRRYSCPVCKRKLVQHLASGKFNCQICGAKNIIPNIIERPLQLETRTLTFRKDLPYFDIFYNYLKKRYLKQTIFIISRNSYNIYLNRANPMLSPHAFRHSVGRVLDEQGVQIFHIKEILGHKKLETTVTYVTGSKRQVQDIARLGEWAKNYVERIKTPVVKP